MRKTRPASSMMPTSHPRVNCTEGDAHAPYMKHVHRMRVVYLNPNTPVRIVVEPDLVEPAAGPLEQKTISDVWPAFEETLKLRELSRKTITSYREAVTLFERYCAHRGFPANVRELDTRHVRAWMADAADRGHTSDTRRNRFASFRVFARWLVAAGYHTSVLTDGIPEPRTKTRLTPVLSDEQINLLLAVCEGPRFEDARHAHTLKPPLSRRTLAASVTAIWAAN